MADVRAATLKVSRDYDGLADFWEPFLSNATPSSSVAGKMDQETRAALKEEIQDLLKKYEGQVDGLVDTKTKEVQEV